MHRLKDNITHAHKYSNNKETPESFSVGRVHVEGATQECSAKVDGTNRAVLSCICRIYQEMEKGKDKIT